MKKIWVFLTIAVIVFSSTGCGLTKVEPFNINNVYSYRNIPGVTDEEIAAIEGFKQTNRSFTYGHYNSTGSFLLANGTYAGFTIKLCRHLSNLFGTNIVPQPYDEWDGLLTALNEKSVDFMGDLTPTAERANIYYMSMPIADNLQRIFILASNNDLQTEMDVDGKTIGVFTGSANAETVRLKYPTINFTTVYADSSAKLVELLRSGQIDAFLADSTIDPTFAEYTDIKSMEFFPLAYMPVSLSTADPDLQPFISVVNKYIEAGGIDKLYSLYREGEFEYSRYKLSNSFTKEEQTYMNDLKSRRLSILVAMHSDNYPISFYNTKDKEFQGIANDVLNEISLLTGINFKAANEPNVPWGVLIDQMRSGEIPMTAQLLRTSSRNNDFIWVEEPYTRTNYALLSRVDYPHISSYQIMRSTVGMLRGSAYEELFLEIFDYHDKTVVFEDQNTALQALEDGEIDLLMASEYMLLMQTNYREKIGYKINYRLSGIPHDIQFGFNNDEVILRNIIAKAQQYVKVEDISTSWTSRVYDYSKTIASQRNTLLIVSVVFMFVVLAYVMFLLIRNKRLSKSLTEKAFTDSLTGILNRRHFMEMTNVQMDRCTRTGGESFIIIFDLDHFKNVNDTYGHLVGDRVLQGVTKRVKDTIRPYDLFGRYGGEEFILFIADVNRTAIRSLAERIRTNIGNTPIDCDDVQIPITASIGVAVATPKNDLDKATRIADDALYKAKNTGRNRVLFGEN